jgi:hypothetical protein
MVRVRRVNAAVGDRVACEDDEDNEGSAIRVLGRIATGAGAGAGQMERSMSRAVLKEVMNH